MTAASPTSKRFTTRCGVDLHYLRTGRGEPLVFLPGWSQTAAMFRGQLDDLGADHLCLALDWRGHGESAKPTTGYRHSRLAMDLHEWILALDLEDVTLIGHSMACNVIWNYSEIFGTRRLKRLVLVDQPARLLIDPDWSDADRLRFGAQADYPALEALCRRLAGPDGEAATREMLEAMFSPAFSREALDWVTAQNLRLPRPYAARLLRETAISDCRDLLPGLSLPTLVVAGTASHLPVEGQRWISTQIPNSTLTVMPADAGGSHFGFVENPPWFNWQLREFLRAHPLSE